MAIKYEDLKSELQGSSGLIKKVRDRYIPDTIEMSSLAQKEYEKKHNNFKDLDFALNHLLVFEYEIYLKKQKLITDSFIELANKEATRKEYPNVRKVLDAYKRSIKSLNGIKDPTSILSGIISISTALADSNRQSRVARSGSSLMHHIAYLLDKHGFTFGKDYQREFVLKEGCKLDFFFPDLKVYNDEPKNCCSVACQTTSNDRFRLTFAQMPSDTRNRACTAIGNANFGSKLGPDSLTDNKLAEAKKNGVKFVIINDGIDARLKKSNAVMSYTDWFAELKSIKEFWK